MSSLALQRESRAHYCREGSPTRGYRTQASRVKPKSSLSTGMFLCLVFSGTSRAQPKHNPYLDLASKQFRNLEFETALKHGCRAR